MGWLQKIGRILAGGHPHKIEDVATEMTIMDGGRPRRFVRPDEHSPWRPVGPNHRRPPPASDFPKPRWLDDLSGVFVEDGEPSLGDTPHDRSMLEPPGGEIWPPKDVTIPTDRILDGAHVGVDRASGKDRTVVAHYRDGVLVRVVYPDTFSGHRWLVWQRANGVPYASLEVMNPQQSMSWDVRRQGVVGNPLKIADDELGLDLDEMRRRHPVETF